MKILRLRAYFAPELASSSQLINDMDELYEKTGITVINYTPMPSRGISDEIRNEYKKKKHEVFRNGSIEVYRFPMFKEGKNPIQRALRYFCCNILEYFIGIRAKDIDMVHSSSTPPTQGMLSAMVAKKLSKKYGHKVPFVYNLQDIFPDSLVNAGMTKKGSILWKIGRKIEDYTYKSADKIIVISEGFKKNIMEKGVPEEKIEIVSNWVDLDNIQPVKKEDNRLFAELGIDSDKFTVVYAGNLGEMQGGEIIVKTAKMLEDNKDIQFVIFGGGSQFENIKNMGKALPNIRFFGLLPQKRVAEVYSLGDVNLITCKKGTGYAGFPNKTWSIMACGKPILASFDGPSDFSDVLTASLAGKCTKPGDANALADAIIAFMKQTEKPDADKIRQYAIENASKEVCTKKYLAALEQAYSAVVAAR